LRELCAEAGDKASLAVAMTGLLSDHWQHGRLREASRLADEQMALVESIGDPALTVGTTFAAISTKMQNGEMTDVLRWCQTTIDWTDGDPAKGNLIGDSPLATALAFRGSARWWHGRPNWRDDLNSALAIAHNAGPSVVGFVTAWVYGNGISNGVLRVDTTTMHNLEQALLVAEASSDDNVVGSVKWTFASSLTFRGSATDRERRLAMLAQVRDMALQHRFPQSELPMIDLIPAYERARDGDHDEALPQMRKSVNEVFNNGQYMYATGAIAFMVEALLSRGNESDLAEAEATVARLAAIPGHEWVARDIMVLRLRTLLAQAHGDEASYRDYRDRYRDMARTLGFEGHIAWAEAMP
jgi:adenylate cyclase